MANSYHEVHKYRGIDEDGDGEVIRETTEIESESDLVITKVQMVIRFISGLIAGLLTLRFVLALFGANQANAFVDFIYTTTSPLVRPFRDLFNTDAALNAARFENDTLFALIVYLLIAVGVIRLLEILKRQPR